jgi:phage terminase large subunit-like protein
MSTATRSRSSTTSRRSAARRPKTLEPFTLDHFRSYSSLLVYDDGEQKEPEDWQLEIVESFLERFIEVWAVVPEGNGKTTLMAQVALYHGDHHPSPWVPIGAASRDQAEILFAQAAGFVERTPGLERRFRVYNGYRKIDCLRQGGRGIRVYAADAGTGDGVIPTLALIDEPHRHKDMSLYRLWKGKLRKRGGQIGLISTAGEPGHEFEETREQIRNRSTERLRRGAYLRAEFPGGVMHEYMVRDPRRVMDMAAVKEANPFSGVSIASLTEDFSSPTTNMGDWVRLKCNRPMRSSETAITDAEWDAAQVDDQIPEGAPIGLGVDIAWKWDCTALVPLWLRDAEYRLLGAATILEPPRDGTTLDPQEVKAALDRINEHNPIELIVMDMHRGEDIAAWCENDRGWSVMDRPQTPKFAVEDYDRWMEALSNGWLRHTGDPGLRSHVLNAIARKTEGDKMRFDRPSSSRSARSQNRKVIDALSAAAMVNNSYGGQPDPAPMFAFG